MILSSDPGTERRDRRIPAAVERPDVVEALAAALPAAIERGDIGVRFQPQVRIADDRITGVEALARWDHPLLGAIDADLLFSASDRAGLSRRLSDHIHEAALAVVGEWPAALGELVVSLNVTAGDLADERFAASLLDRVVRNGVAPSRLCLEVTEAAPIGDLASTSGVLQRFRDVGMEIAIDDVGAGHAGISYLRALPFDRFKIDKSITADIPGNARALALVRGMIALAGALDLSVVAEGVETEAQRACLAREHCGWYQGFLCAEAIDTPALSALIRERTSRFDR